MAVKVDYANKIDTSAINPVNANEGIDVVYLTGAGYIDYPFRGISRDSALGWEEAVWGGDLTRSSNFVLTNITDVNYGKVARLEFSYKYMNVLDYEVLMEISKQRVCYATYFNRETGKWTIRQEMAFTGNELGKLYAFGVDYIGTMDVKIKLVATNRDMIEKTFNISFNKNNSSATGSIANYTIKWSKNTSYKKAASIKGNTAFALPGYEIKYFSTNPDGTGKKYLPNQDITIFGDLTLYAQWEFHSISFSEDNWDVINAVSKTGKAMEYYNIGDEKTITLSTGENVTLVILGFNHDDLRTTVIPSDKKSGITIGMKNLLATEYKINATNTNIGGWETSLMRTETIQTLKSQLPSDLQEVIKTVEKRTTIGNKSITPLITEDTIFLFSEVEIDGTSVDGYKNEGTQYDYWKTIKDGTIAANRIKYTSNGSGYAMYWWLRSPSLEIDNMFRIFDESGELGNSDATSEIGISFGFCV